ncbi:NADH-quinone oxidoreductase subunit G [Trueperella pecoris]|uniref:NADH-quinone oxidoreductase subunit G n=1 Tax=Trueperella pecoris TaxID=2733571 RepID=A0A7M1QV99_9ACTO|nr:NADH-quinone oxidoreductase subunit G [Trueperella pecoris]QOQ39296.1 NADH-quinone oxidoreductase subunit G [Trueperella pecoris]QOR46062.1 NADH-quinone oxidoreductase subunit G [Trueperella pecoris]
MTTKNAPADLITIKVDGKEVSVPKGTLIIRAAEKIGVHIPRFCDHPLLAPAAACRQCLVEVASPNRDGVVSKMPKPQPACAVTVSPNMEVYTAATSQVAQKAQHGVMEFLLINHPMDCPVCDKGGECPLQNQAMSDGRVQSRFVDIKRTYPKPISVSPQILLDRDRCILCQRCTRFSTQIAGDAFIQLQGRGGGSAGREVHGLHGSQIGNFDASVLDFSDADGSHAPVVENSYAGPDGAVGRELGFSAGPVEASEMDVTGKPFSSYFSGNVIQICPVGALTSTSYRFRARPFDLVSVPSITEHDASGSAIRVDYRRGTVVRRLAQEDMDVNESWITDKDRFAFRWQTGPDRLTYPRIAAQPQGPTSWFEALEAAAEGLAAAKGKGIGVITGGRLTLEDAYAYTKFARVVLGTNDIDFRTRPGSAEEDQFLAAHVAGSELGVTYADIEHAGHVLTVGLEAEDEIGSVFLRLRKGALAKSTSVTVISAYKTLGTSKMKARFLPAVPGTEAEVLDAVYAGNANGFGDVFDDLSKDGSVILVGERTADTPGALSAAVRLAQRTGARLAWVPRRAGDRGAVDAGVMPNLLPGGRQVADAGARIDVAAVWGVPSLPETIGRRTDEILAAAAAGEIGAVLLGGVELSDLPAGAAEALRNVFVVQLEVRETSATELADVVLPVAPPAEKGGTFVNWEGRLRPFGQTIVSKNLSDRRVLSELAAEMGVELGLDTLKDAVEEMAELRRWDGARAELPNLAPAPAPTVGAGQVVLASWKQMIDAGALLSGEPYLAKTARKPVAVMSANTAASAGITDTVTLSGPDGSLTYDVAIVAMPDAVVWVPQNSLGSQIASIGCRPGDVVGIRR